MTFTSLKALVVSFAVGTFALAGCAAAPADSEADDTSETELSTQSSSVVVRKPWCQHTGCSGQVCSDMIVMTTCEWRPEYACYQAAACERQADGKCGFTKTPELEACLDGAGSTAIAR